MPDTNLLRKRILWGLRQGFQQGICKNMHGFPTVKKCKKMWTKLNRCHFVDFMAKVTS